ncbi:tetraspanin-19-like [Quillaja saponaria]|uniref:Tetraspanin-19-like n=1 Tax=Quillaja saponaria TaxID=32244 RepID=A0AAD7M263_QUISA|nr:tetraspanin-19-like [Quillaja saponaria]
MATNARTCLQLLLKVVNSMMGMVGIAMILYGLWMVRVWRRETDSIDEFNAITPWFAYASIGTGAILCLITCIGHIAADSTNEYCLSCYMVISILLLFLESAGTADIFLNSDWEKDLPEDPTGKFDDFKDFVKSNFVICKWIGLVIISAQGLSILLTIVLRAIGPNQGSYFDTDDAYSPAMLPFLNHHPQLPTYVVSDPQFASNCKTNWNTSNEEKGMPNFLTTKHWTKGSYDTGKGAGSQLLVA